ncbi:MAG: hypothetical protein AAGB04_15910 [Pseudomonadota bacterium]
MSLCNKLTYIQLRKLAETGQLEKLANAIMPREEHEALVEEYGGLLDRETLDSSCLHSDATQLVGSSAIPWMDCALLMKQRRRSPAVDMR